MFENVLSVGGSQAQTGLQICYRPGCMVEMLASARHTDVRWRDGTRRTVWGSSFAAPVVAGHVALAMERWPDIDLDGVREMFRYQANSRPHLTVDCSE